MRDADRGHFTWGELRILRRATGLSPEQMSEALRSAQRRIELAELLRAIEGTAA